MSQPTKSIKVHISEAIVAMALMIGLGWMLAAGLDRQLQVEQAIVYEGAGK